MSKIVWWSFNYDIQEFAKIPKLEKHLEKPLLFISLCKSFIRFQLLLHHCNQYITTSIQLLSIVNLLNLFKSFHLMPYCAERSDGILNYLHQVSIRKFQKGFHWGKTTTNNFQISRLGQQQFLIELTQIYSSFQEIQFGNMSHSANDTIYAVQFFYLNDICQLIKAVLVVT